VPGREDSDRSGTPVTALSGLAVTRADDLLDLRFEFANLGVAHNAGGPALVRVDPSAPAFITVWFPPQSVGESFLISDPEQLIRARLSAPTRLVFRVPAQMSAVPLTIDGLLGWRALEPSLAPNALGVPPSVPTPAPVPAEPGALMTAIEAPYRLVLSPGPNGRWSHATAPVTRTGRTELWHTRLIPRPSPFESDAERNRAVRAIWSPDRTAPDGVQFTPLSAARRSEFVTLSSDFSIEHGTAPAIAASLLMLSARGAWLDLSGEWLVPEPPIPQFDLNEIHTEAEQALRQAALGEGLETRFVRDAIQVVVDGAASAPDVKLALLREILHDMSQFPDEIGAISGVWYGELPVRETIQWRHRASQGRDNAVRVTTPGFLYPFGHRVTLVEVTEREPHVDGDGQLTAYLVMRPYIVVKEPFIDYRPLLGAYAHAGRESPFRSARLSATISPTIDPVVIVPNGVFWPRALDGSEVVWAVACEDQLGRIVNLNMPLLFVPAVDGQNRPFDPTLADRAYRQGDRRHVDGAGQEIAFVDSPRGEGVMATRSLVMDARTGPGEIVAGLLPPGAAQFLPSIESAAVGIPSVDALLGAAGAAAGTPITYDTTYLQSAFDETVNKGQLFARIGGALDLKFNAERAGGLTRPDMAVTALSKLLGPVPDADHILNGVFDAERFLPDAKVLGGISLKKLLAPLLEGFKPSELTDLAGLDPAALWEKLDHPETVVKLPAFTSRKLRDAAGTLTAIETQYVWKPDLQKAVPIDVPVLRLNAGARLRLATTLRAPLDGSEPTFESHGELSDFGFTFAEIVEVTIAKLGFLARNGRKLDVTAEGVALHFVGPLAFVEEIRHYLPANGFSDPPAVTVTPDGITAGYSLGLPTIGVGVFSLENVALSASLTLPFVDAPARLRFALSERHDPFLVTVSLFGGGGFFALGVHGNGDVDVEASIEFGGNFSLDLIVASGGVHVMAGIYFKLAGSLVELSGYLRAGGSLSVLGVSPISVEFYLGLTYAHDNRPPGTDRVWGEASVTVGVEVLFFSQDVTLHVKREFIGHSGDPTFRDLVEPGDWATYCAAFAA
jgi:hypothetical protein